MATKRKKSTKAKTQATRPNRPCRVCKLLTTDPDGLCGGCRAYRARAIKLKAQQAMIRENQRIADARKAAFGPVPPEETLNDLREAMK